MLPVLNIETNLFISLSPSRKCFSQTTLLPLRNTFIYILVYSSVPTDMAVIPFRKIASGTTRMTSAY